MDYSLRQSQHLSFTDRFATDIRHIHKEYVIADTICKTETAELLYTDFQQLAKDQAAYIETLADRSAVTVLFLQTLNNTVLLCDISLGKPRPVVLRNGL